MRFALLGDHADGLDMARALAESGRHELAVYSGNSLGLETLQRWNLHPDRVGDIEEVLADPRIDAVIIAGNPADRPAQLRRALQSERHVLCVHPADQNPDTAYEAAMIQADTKQILFPLLSEAIHPGFRRLAEWIRSPEIADCKLQIADLQTSSSQSAICNLQSAIATKHSPLTTHRSPLTTHLSPLRLVEVERWSTDRVLLEAEIPGRQPSFPCWDVLRLLGGEIVEVSAFAEEEEVPANAPVVVSGRFELGGLFHEIFLPNQTEARWRLTVVTQRGRAELIFPHGWPGPATLSWSDEIGAGNETWDTWNPWPGLVVALEDALGSGGVVNDKPPLTTHHSPLTKLSWKDEIRCLELDAAARRSIERRRTSTLEYQEATEEAGFKGTMTLVGCGLIWLTLVLLILSAWIPWMGWLIVPVLTLFLFMQLLRWIVPPALPPTNPVEPRNEDKVRNALSDKVK